MKKFNAWLLDWGWWLRELINARPLLFLIVNFVLLLIITGLLGALIDLRKDSLWLAVPLLAVGELLLSIIVFIIISKQNRVGEKTPRKRGPRTRH